MMFTVQASVRQQDIQRYIKASKVYCCCCYRRVGPLKDLHQSMRFYFSNDRNGWYMYDYVRRQKMRFS